MAYGGAKWGNFLAVSGLQTGRFLDPPNRPSFTTKATKPTHSTASTTNSPTPIPFSSTWVIRARGFKLPILTTRSLQPAGTRLALAIQTTSCGGLGPNGELVGPQDQRSKIGTFNVAPTFVHLIGAEAVWTIGAFVRQDQFDYYPSQNPFADFTPNLQSDSIAQQRRLTNAGVRSDLSYVKGIHNFKAGITYEQTSLTEHDSFGIVDPALLPST